MERITKKCETCGIKNKNSKCFVEYTSFSYNSIGCKYLCCNKIYQKKFHENLKNDFLIHISFLTMISICFSFCSGKVLTLMTIWMTGTFGTFQMEHFYLKKKVFTVTETWKFITDAGHKVWRKSLQRIKNKKIRGIS